jgi:hypothetical protein
MILFHLGTGFFLLFYGIKKKPHPKGDPPHSLTCLPTGRLQKTGL